MSEVDPEVVKALSSEKRLQVLEWLRDPVANFPPQVYGDLVKDGVCSIHISAKLGVSQPTAGEHLKILSRAGLVTGKKIRQWVFYRRDEARIKAVKKMLSGNW
jgi:DNA-binding transcriptional ArsR family regulator